MAQVTYPGVYVEEVPSGVRPIAAASTSIAAFIGVAERGPVGEAVKVFNFTEYQNRTSGVASASSSVKVAPAANSSRDATEPLGLGLHNGGVETLGGAVLRPRNNPPRTPPDGIVNLLRLIPSLGTQGHYPAPPYLLDGSLRARHVGPALELLPHLLTVIRR
jgi:hypothetical protein